MTYYSLDLILQAVRGWRDGKHGDMAHLAYTDGVGQKDGLDCDKFKQGSFYIYL